MTTYKDLQAQIAELQIEAQEVHTREIEAAVTQIRSLMSEFGIKAEDLESRTPKKSREPQSMAEIRFRNGEKTWSGRGRPPLWLKGKDKERYRVS
jgi:DNA-binding protein H-NS